MFSLEDKCIFVQLIYALLAQSVERQTLNLMVAGSSPAEGDLLFFFRFPSPPGAARATAAAASARGVRRRRRRRRGPSRGQSCSSSSSSGGGGSSPSFFSLSHHHARARARTHADDWLTRGGGGRSGRGKPVHARRRRPVGG